MLSFAVIHCYAVSELENESGMQNSKECFFSFYFNQHCPIYSFYFNSICIIITPARFNVAHDGAVG